jgi:formylglycine-generating enzyme required for sulfatase activity
VNWDGSNESIEFRKLVEDITAKIGKPAGKVTTPQTSTIQPLPESQPSIAIDNRKPGTIFRDTLKDGTQGPEMIVIPAGNFQMGDIHGMGDESEKPVHTVHIQKPFAIGRYQVTFEEYDKYAQSTQRELPKDAGWGRGKRPVINVSWDEAVEYTKWLCTRMGHRYRLPTEAEWEYAARSGGKDEIWAGTSDKKQLADYAIFDKQLGDYAVFDKKQTEPVGSRKPNGLSLYDMSGNVFEWVEDCWHETYDDAPTDGSAWFEAGGGICGWRVLRGGSWNFDPGFLRSSYRFRNYAVNRNDYIGFRLTRDLE